MIRTENKNRQQPWVVGLAVAYTVAALAELVPFRRQVPLSVIPILVVLTLHNALTGLSNRRALFDLGAHKVAAASRARSVLTWPYWYNWPLAL